MTGGPPQEGQIIFLSASLIAMFSHRILSFSARRAQLSALSCCAYKIQPQSSIVIHYFSLKKTKKLNTKLTYLLSFLLKEKKM